MIGHEHINQLETRLTKLVDRMLADKGTQVDFLIGLNQLDDVLLKLQAGQFVNADISAFFAENKSWLENNILNTAQKKRLAALLHELQKEVSDDKSNADSTLSMEIDRWLGVCKSSAVRLTLKAPEDQISLADRFSALMHKELEELAMLLSRHDHLLTCLDDVLSSAEHKTDRMYHHLAASLIYYLKLEGYKVEPYVKKLRELREKG